MITKLSFVLRITTLCILLLLLLIPTSWVDDLIGDRLNQREYAAEDIAQVWGGRQVVVGPYLLLEYKQLTGKEQEEASRRVELLPAHLSVDANVEAEERFRGIYGIPVYTSTIRAQAEFSDAVQKHLSSLDSAFDITLSLCLGVQDRIGLKDIQSCTINRQKVSMYHHTGHRLADYVLSANIDTTVLRETNAVEIVFTLRGTRTLHVATIGSKNEIHMQSNWSDPKFNGDYLPTERTVSDEGFSSTWEINSFTSEESLSGYTRAEIASLGSVGADLFQSVSGITLIDRITKYALLVVALTFVTLFLFEVLYKLRIHPMQYTLIGLSLIVFYVLLIGVGEHMDFNIAYALSSAATIALIYMYIKWTTKVRKCIYTTLAVLVGVYSYMFVLIRLEDFALFAGSIGVFAALGIVMFVTRNVDWYALHQTEQVDSGIKNGETVADE